MHPKILAVDDSKTIRMIVSKAFKSFDCDVFEATNGLEGLSIAGKEKPDVIILDITMPVMNGYEMLNRLRADRDLRQIPVIMLTAEVGRDNVIKVARHGVRDYIVKPFKEDLIVERVSRVIELKPRAANGSQRPRRFDEPVKVAILDDKPAIAEQIREGFADRPWQITPFATAAAAIDAITKETPDILLASLSLPDDGAFTAFETVRSAPATRHLPIFGLCVKTAATEQSRATHAGFTAIVNKPIDLDDLAQKIARALNLDTSPKYFREQSGVLVLSVPAAFNAVVATEISSRLKTRIAEAVDAGLTQVILDISQARAVDITLIRLAIEAMQLCQSLSLKHRVVGSANIIKDCKNYEEAKDWQFVSSVDEALAALKPVGGKPAASTAPAAPAPAANAEPAPAAAPVAEPAPA